MVRVRKPQYAKETQLASFCKLFDIHIYPAHNYQMGSGHWGQFSNSNQGHFLSAIQLSRIEHQCYTSQVLHSDLKNIMSRSLRNMIKFYNLRAFTNLN